MGVTVREKRGRLYLDIYRNGNRKWEALHLTVTGNRAQDKEIRKIAEKCRSKKEMELAAGEWNIQDSAAGRISAAEYAAKVAAMPGRCSNIKNCAGKLKAYKDGVARMSMLTPRWVEDFQDYLKFNAGLSLPSAAAYATGLRAILNQAVRDSVILKSPAAGVAPPKAPEKEIVFLSVPELRALSASAGNPAWADVARAFLFGYYTGLRISDLRTFAWGQISRQPLRIIKRQEKTGTGVYVPLAAPAWKLVDDGKEHAPDERVFRLPGTNAAYAKLKEWASAAGVAKNLTWHIARKTFATQSLDNGADIYTVSKLLGHTTIKQAEKYAKVTDRLKRAAVDGLPDLAGN
jgi:integrase